MRFSEALELSNWKAKRPLFCAICEDEVPVDDFIYLEKNGCIVSSACSSHEEQVKAAYAAWDRACEIEACALGSPNDESRDTLFANRPSDFSGFSNYEVAQIIVGENLDISRYI